ncbi:TolC family protein [Sphingobacterium chuzhouense]|uniref:TolC family protein n=1 Tax=Sphingobacterium chuzhouense TaxID=1742264 RepID=A0ABR7XRG2_9SPHI|nr:TolC family protein [Sphingobacterium chuzhouense]MBD1421765.1 TolC family protein [Sphingobacterium chuzhouense]
MRFYIVILFFFVASLSRAQSYSLAQLEASFLKENYLLLAAKFDVSKAEAEIVQEKVWANPSLAVSEVNLWANAGSETLSPLFGSYGKTQQVSVELEQLVETAGKRKKRVAIKRLEHRMAVYEFEELVRELRKELRQHFHHLATLKHSQTQLVDMVKLFQQLEKQYQRQVQQENVSKADYNRVHNELLRMQKDLAELEADAEAGLSTLRVLTGINDLEIEKLSVAESFVSRTLLVPKDITNLIAEQNIGIKKQSTAIEMAKQHLELEKAQRTPDVTLQLGYDRGGNIMQDFIGLGVQVDLPVFNRNKGNIQKAKHQIDQEHLTYTALQRELEQTVLRCRNQLLKYENVLNQWTDGMEEGQDGMIDNYRKHLENRQVTLMEFMDYVQSHREARAAFLDLWQDYNNTFEELQYLIGKDF